MIEIKKIHKKFGDNDVLQGISAKFKPGKNNLIIGSSGSGKTTLLKCIVGLHEPTTGEVLYNNENFSAMDFQERVPIRKQIGMLFQNSALFDSMNVEQNIMFPLNLFTEMSKAEKQERADFCLEKVNLAGTNKLFPSELSGGMKKRVGIARAISMQPKYLFVDEPNSGLDPKTAILIDHLINELTEEYEMTTVIVTHDMNSVMGIGDHVLFLHNGKKWWEGSNHEIAHTDNKELNEFVFASKFMLAARSKL
jgi:phospholipid/cholesterol/gamma-HCH transport system ATP-binding protein